MREAPELLFGYLTLANRAAPNNYIDRFDCLRMKMGPIGTFDAKTHLSRLLDQVAPGESYTITRHGRPVAKLVPIDAAQRAAKPDVRAAIARLHKLSKGVRLGNIRLRDLIEERRKS